jgi:hypothetical protein
MGRVDLAIEEVLEDGPFEADPAAFVAPPAGEAQSGLAPAAPVEPPGFAVLRQLLDDPRPFADEHHRKKAGRFVRRALHGVDFEKAVLDPTLPVTWRLRRLTDLQHMASASDLRPRDKDETLVELDRCGMRILWAAQLVEKVLGSAAPVESRAGALLWLISEKILPSGACARAALEPAKQLLQTEEAHQTLKKSPAMREQILELLAHAEARRAA